MIQSDITIIDYGMGNIRSVYNALARMGCHASIAQSPDELLHANAFLLPGVGAFGEAMTNLHRLGMVEPVRRAVLAQRKPILGICLGMQLLAESSQERGVSEGLALIPGAVERLPVPDNMRLPHIGWNSVEVFKRLPLFEGFPPGGSFYFVHSYHYVCDKKYVAAVTDYGGSVVAAVQHENIFGVQFHPERSQTNGLRLIENFVNHSRAHRQAA
jgi:imidazole glycerol-phosphate synthase subunit HisH